ncbi:hypothetical protein ACFFGN_28100 [Kribbella deserti]|uniref:HEAT repeat domain-containing protein n=2 Tax=Kribbella deserti TaxID=1926257 RepID=A0ABV6QTK5_9ACTN
MEWAGIRSAESSAEFVPAAVANLLDEDFRTRDDAYASLDNGVVQDGRLSEAAYYVVPLLIDLLERATSDTGKDLVYDLLYEIGNGWADDVDHVTLPDGSAVPLGIACRRAVRDHVRLYLRDVTATDATVRRRVLDVLVSMNEPDRPGEIQRLLGEVATTDSLVLADIAQANRDL